MLQTLRQIFPNTTDNCVFQRSGSQLQSQSMHDFSTSCNYCLVNQTWRCFTNKDRLGDILATICHSSIVSAHRSVVGVGRSMVVASGEQDAEVEPDNQRIFIERWASNL